VTGIIRPTSDSQIKFAVWLPMAGWNGKYTQLGNGGLGRQHSIPADDRSVRRGYATGAPTTVTKAVVAPPGPSGIRRN
jgi:feruloyl esterase